MTAVIARDPLAAARQAALERYEQRRNQYESHTDAEHRHAWLEGRSLPRQDLFAPIFRAPQTLGEWLDDRVLERNGVLLTCPETRILIAVAEAAREGTGAAVRAVRAARQLGRAAQWVTYQCLVQWKDRDDAGKTGGEQLVSAVLAEWSKLRLAQKDPDDE